MSDRRPSTPEARAAREAPRSDPGDGEHWVQRWRVDHRIALAVGLPIVLLLAGAVFVAFQANGFADMHEQEAEERRELDETVELRQSFTDVVGASRTYVITGDTQNRSRLESRIGTFEDRLSSYEAPVEDADRQASFTAFQENATAYVELVRQAQGEVESGNMEDARELVTSPRADRLQTNALSAIDSLIDPERRDVENQRERLSDARSDLDRMLVLGTLGILVLTGVVGYDVARQTRDTTEQLSATIRDRLARLEDAREAERAHLDAQAASLAEARAHLEETETACQAIHRHLAGVAENVRGILDVTREGTERAQGTLSGFEETDERVNTVTERILEIGDEVDHLEAVADEVESIASEIDMLALNASVEASRTGGESPGLNEVRELADRSETRAQRLQEIADAALEQSEAAAMALEQSGKAVDENREGTQGVVDVLKHVEERIQTGLAETEEMRDMANEQIEALDEVAARLAEAREEANAAAGASERAEELVDDLGDASRRLREMT